MGGRDLFLSRGGRLPLIESILSSVLIYFLSLFKIPVSVAKEIESLMRDFLWEGCNDEVGDHLVAWKKVCLPKVYSGLGLGNLVRRNKSLLFKWLWRFPLEKYALWYAVIKSKYELNENQWDSGINHMGTHRNPWKFISSLYGEFHSWVAFKVGNGTKLRFWDDVWREGWNCVQVSVSNFIQIIFEA